jgi:hypothetical protein
MDDASEEDLGPEEHLHLVLATAVICHAPTSVHDLHEAPVSGNRGLRRTRLLALEIDVLCEGIAGAHDTGVVDRKHDQAVAVAGRRRVAIFVSELNLAENSYGAPDRRLDRWP